MKTKSLLLIILVVISFGMVFPRHANASVTFSYFYDALQPYGEWVDVESYGYCWHPRVDADWRPYTDGYWSYTDAGWTWVSYEDFGDIVYHYGRWVRLEDFGWVWKPDYEWGPAWVSWRESDDYVGWAPLPPAAVFDDDAGIGVWVDRDYDIGPSAYVFCEHRYFGAPVILNFIIPRHRNTFIINSTVNITNIAIVQGHEHGRLIYNGGPDYHRLAQRSEQPIATLQLVRQTSGDWEHQHRAVLSRQMGSQLIVNAPQIVAAPAAQTRIAPPAVARQISAPKIDRGWSGVTDPAERQRIQQRYHDQTNGLTRATAPAVRVNAPQIQAVVNENRVQPQGVPSTQNHQHFGIQPQPTIVPQTIGVQPQVQPAQPQPQQTPQSQRDHQRHGNPTPANTGFVQPQITQPTPQAVQPQQTQTPADQHRKHPQIEQPQPSAVVTPHPQGNQSQAVQQQAEQAQREQQRAAQEAQARAAEQQQTERARQEQLRSAQEAQARAAQQQAQQAQREQQRAAQEAQARAAQQQAARQQQLLQQQQATQGAAAQQARHGQQSGSPTPDDRKKHQDQPSQ